MLRTLQLEVALFNEMNASIVFAVKVYAISIFVFCGFGALQFAHESPLLAGFNGLFVAEAVLIFSVLYDRGFAIPLRLKGLRRKLLFRLESISNNGMEGAGSELEWNKRKLESIRTMSIRVGCFHYLQRLSTPSFMDFSVKNMVRLDKLTNRLRPVIS